MSVKTETHILCSGCRWVGFKEERYLRSPQSRASQGLAQPGAILTSSGVAASCAQLLVAPDTLPFWIPNQRGPAIHLI